MVECLNRRAVVSEEGAINQNERESYLKMGDCFERRGFHEERREVTQLPRKKKRVLRSKRRFPRK